MVKMASKKEPSWDEIGKQIGSKIEKAFKEGECKGWGKKFVFKQEKNIGFPGRFIFAMGIWAALTIAGIWTFPWWVTLLIVLGFTLMRF